MDPTKPQDPSPTPTPEPVAPPEPEAKAPKAADPFDVFDGAPTDPTKAAPPRAEPAAKGAPKGGAKKGNAKKGKGAEPPAPSAEEVEAAKAKKLQEARGVLQTLNTMQRMRVRSVWQEHVRAQLLESVLEELKLTEEELEAMADPLAEGMTEEGLDMPWWLRLGLASFPMFERQSQAAGKLKRAAENPGAQVVDSPGRNAETLERVHADRKKAGA